jgi:hypothetical protein
VEVLSYDNLMALVHQLQAEVMALKEENAALKAENERLKKEAGSPPPWVKPSRPEPSEEKPPRKKRAVNGSRPRETPTQCVEHRLSKCPDCGGPVSEGFEKRRRQVVEIPLCPVEVTDHVIYGHYCGYCEKEKTVSVSPAEIGTVGEGRLGVRLRSLVSLLRTEGRLPFRTIRTLLFVQYGVRVSVGELVEIVHSTAERGKKEAEAVLHQVIAAPVVQADETGWREDGRNGWLWSFSTPEGSETPLRYFHHDPSRSKAVVERVLGIEDEEKAASERTASERTASERTASERTASERTFSGVLVSDFYGAYSAYLGSHQRCWVHLLRDLHDLKKKHPDDAGVEAWTQAVKAVYDRAKAWKPPRPNSRFEERDRQQAQSAFEAELSDLAKPYRSDPSAPPHTLSKRIENFLPELFVFVADPRVPSDNNGAERSLRPSVIARKISGGTRSKKGSQTRTILMTLFATWKLQGKDLMETCRQMLLSPSFPPISPPLASA